MVWQGAGAAAISAAASLFGGHRAEKATDRRLRAQMDFQREMSSTAYQRAMADMRKAGLNPILAYKQGGASSPAGASAPGVDIISPAVNSAISARRSVQELRNMDATEALTSAQKVKAEAEADKTRGMFRPLHNKAYHEASTAYEKLLQEKERTKRMQRFGESALGRGVGSFEKMLETLSKWHAKSKTQRKEVPFKQFMRGQIGR